MLDEQGGKCTATLGNDWFGPGRVGEGGFLSRMWAGGSDSLACAVGVPRGVREFSCIAPKHLGKSSGDEEDVAN